MALLKSVDNVPGIDFYDYREEAYYGKYIFRLRVEIPGIRYSYWCNDPEDLDKKLTSRNAIKKKDILIVKDNLSAIKTVIELQKERKKTKDLGIRIESENIAFFSNDLSKLQEIEKTIGNAYTYDYTQVQTAQFAGIKYFVNEPKHKYRVYLKSRRVDDKFHDELKDTITKSKTLYPSEALQHWYNRNSSRWGIWHFRWTSSAHFIDYDDESTLSYLALIHGDILGKKYKLEKRSEDT